MIEAEGLPKVLPGVDSISEGTNKPLHPRSHLSPQVVVYSWSSSYYPRYVLELRSE
jgi:hypothetical protein